MFDRPLNNAKIYTNNIIPIEMDNYTTISDHAIDSDFFIQQMNNHKSVSHKEDNDTGKKYDYLKTCNLFKQNPDNICTQTGGTKSLIVKSMEWLMGPIDINQTGGNDDITNLLTNINKLYTYKDMLEPKIITHTGVSDLSGNKKKRERLVFLLILPDSSTYVIKISTKRYPTYQKEALVYKKFREISNDSNEQYAKLIKDQVLQSYFYGNINDVTAAKNIIYLTPEIGIELSDNHNADIRDRIRQLAQSNRTKDVYYFITENVLDEYFTLKKMKHDQQINEHDICPILMNLFNMLSYLNTKYDFIHWDLHAGNIFIHKQNKLSFKLYDFDFSEIRSDSNTAENNLLLTHIHVPPPVLSRKDRNDLGFAYDLYRAFWTYNKKNTCGNDKLEKLKKYIDTAGKYVMSFNHWKTVYETAVIISNDKLIMTDLRNLFHL